MEHSQLYDNLLKNVVNDYFTPNIKAEVILDTLLTPCIEQIVENGCKDDGDLTLAAKEMSLPVGEKFGSTGFKTDYILAGSNNVYLVELKTAKSSLNEKQLKNYEKWNGKSFAASLGRQLLEILGNNFSNVYDKGDLSPNDETLKKTFKKIVGEYYKPELTSEAINSFINDRTKPTWCSDTAKELIKKNGWANKSTSRKYLYTLGVLADYLRNGGSLCDKEIKIIYIAPDVGEEGVIEISGCKFPAIDLKDAVLALEDNGDDNVKLLNSIIAQIYN